MKMGELQPTTQLFCRGCPGQSVQCPLVLKHLQQQISTTFYGWFGLGFMADLQLAQVQNPFGPDALSVLIPDNVVLPVSVLGCEAFHHAEIQADCQLNSRVLSS